MSKIITAGTRYFEQSNTITDFDKLDNHYFGVNGNNIVRKHTSATLPVYGNYNSPICLLYTFKDYGMKFYIVDAGVSYIDFATLKNNRKADNQTDAKLCGIILGTKSNVVLTFNVNLENVVGCSKMTGSVHKANTNCLISCSTDSTYNLHDNLTKISWTNAIPSLIVRKLKFYQMVWSLPKSTKNNYYYSNNSSYTFQPYPLTIASPLSSNIGSTQYGTSYYFTDYYNNLFPNNMNIITTDNPRFNDTRIYNPLTMATAAFVPQKLYGDDVFKSNTILVFLVDGYLRMVIVNEDTLPIEISYAHLSNIEYYYGNLVGIICSTKSVTQVGFDGRMSSPMITYINSELLNNKMYFSLGLNGYMSRIVISAVPNYTTLRSNFYKTASSIMSTKNPSELRNLILSTDYNVSYDKLYSNIISKDNPYSVINYTTKQPYEAVVEGYNCPNALICSIFAKRIEEEKEKTTVLNVLLLVLILLLLILAIVYISKKMKYLTVNNNDSVRTIEQQ